EAVNAGADQVLDIGEFENVRKDVDVVLVRLVDDRAIKVGLELCDGAVAVVNPDLDHVDLFGGELLHVFACLSLGGDPIGGIAHRAARAGVRHAEAAAGGAKQRGSGRHFPAQVVDQIA